jgi:hypothetical protein
MCSEGYNERYKTSPYGVRTEATKCITFEPKEEDLNSKRCRTAVVSRVSPAYLVQHNTLPSSQQLFTLKHCASHTHTGIRIVLAEKGTARRKQTLRHAS